ncbi:MAG: HEAT repeat domain-containing protein [Desulfobacteraceae bacterium]|jgi:HEAT repeat protein
MDHEKVIPFNSKQRLIDKVIQYLDDYEISSNCPEQAISTFKKALKIVDRQIKHRIISLLGSQNSSELVWPLYQLMVDEQQSEDIRHHASVQLNILAASIENPNELISCLTKDLNHSQPFTRALAVFALGWEGNLSVAIALIEKLYDTDPEVQQAAVDALTNLGDQRLFPFLVERLEHAPMDQKKVILYNLASFTDYHNQVIEIYHRYMEHEDPDIRCDALAVMGSVAGSEVFMAAIARGLKDPNRQVKTLCLENLYDFSTEELVSVSSEIFALTSDPEPAVRKAAKKLLASLGPMDLRKDCERYAPKEPSSC